MIVAATETVSSAGKAAEWNWRSPMPITYSPLFSWPLKPLLILRWFAAHWFALSSKTVVLAFAIISWLYLQPAVERCVTFELDWIAQIFARNLGLMALVAGGLHLYFYSFRKQGAESQFDCRAMETNSPRFTFDNQVWDNMFWTCVSGVTVWTAYESLFMWAFANHIVATLDWRENGVWFVLFFVLHPVWNGAHFYVVHRALHWPPLYKAAHALHHRNSNIGPWTGLSMHPIEHIMYMSSVLLLLVVPAHPIFVLFMLQYLAVSAATSHTGFEKLRVAGTRVMGLGDYFHQLHHRHFECNYGTLEIQCDAWGGSFHDGTGEATKRLRESRRKGFTD